MSALLSLKERVYINSHTSQKCSSRDTSFPLAHGLWDAKAPCSRHTGASSYGALLLLQLQDAQAQQGPSSPRALNLAEVGKCCRILQGDGGQDHTLMCHGALSRGVQQLQVFFSLCPSTWQMHTMQTCVKHLNIDRS